MEKIKNIVNKISSERNINIAAIAMAAVSVLYLGFIFMGHAFDLSKSFKYNLYFCIPFACIIFATYYLIKIFVKNEEFTYSRVYLVLAICWGIAMQFIMPPISGADEPNHVYSAFHAADIIMGLEDGNRGEDDHWEEGESYFLLREDESNGIAAVDLNLPEQYQVIAEGGWFKCVGADYVQCTYVPNSASRYLFSAIGIVIARLLGFGFSGTIMLGRLMNTLIYVLVGWFVVKILPIGKLQTILFSLLPTFLNLTNSYAYDNLSILFSLLLFALCLHYSKSNVVVHIWDYIILAANLIILAPNKIVYLCFGLWIFAIPFKKFVDILKSKKWYEYAGIAAIIVGARYAIVNIFWKYIYIALANTIWKNNMDGIEQDASRASYDWYYITQNPGEVLSFTLKGIKTDFWYNLKHVVGCEIGLIKLNAPVPLWCTLVFMLLIALSYCLVKGKMMPKRQFILFLIGSIVCLVAIFLGCLTRFTPAEGSDRVQVSYRYLVPIYMSLVIMFGVDAKENKKALGLILAENLVLIFTMCNILVFMMNC